jgi:hypothetical protein
MQKVDRRPVETLAWAAMIAVGVLAGCGTAPPAPQEPEKPPVAPAAPVIPPRSVAAQRDLAEGIELYDRGEYNAAINKLANSPDILSAGVEIQISALKYLAFSYCVTRRQTLCRTQFENAFKLNPAFDLAPGERGHPLWGPVFERVRKAHQSAPK